MKVQSYLDKNKLTWDSRHSDMTLKYLSTRGINQDMHNQEMTSQKYLALLSHVIIHIFCRSIVPHIISGIPDGDISIELCEITNILLYVILFLSLYFAVGLSKGKVLTDCAINNLDVWLSSNSTKLYLTQSKVNWFQDRLNVYTCIDIGQFVTYRNFISVPTCTFSEHDTDILAMF